MALLPGLAPQDRGQYPEGAIHSFTLGPNLATGQVLQAWVPAGHWFGASSPKADGPWQVAP